MMVEYCLCARKQVRHARCLAASSPTDFPKRRPTDAPFFKQIKNRRLTNAAAVCPGGHVLPTKECNHSTEDIKR